MSKRARLVAWTLLVLSIAAINYLARFTGTGNASSSARNNEIYSYSTFAGGLIIYALWLVFVLAIAGNDRDLLALRRPQSWMRGARLAVGAIAAIYVLEAAVSLIPLPESPGKEQGLTPTHWEPSHAGAFAANVVLFTLVAPLVEELTFRGLGQSLLLAFMGPWPSAPPRRVGVRPRTRARRGAARPRPVRRRARVAPQPDRQRLPGDGRARAVQRRRTRRGRARLSEATPLRRFRPRTGRA